MKYILAGLIIVSGINIYAQGDLMDSTLSVDRLEFMVGEWEGKGWMMTRNGREESVVQEIVEFKLDKNIMVVEGLGRKMDASGKNIKIVHNAFGVIYADTKNGTLVLNSYKNGETRNSPIKFLSDRVISWSMETPAGEVRFTVDYSESGKWREVGEINRDGTHWMEFLGFELDKINN